MGLLRILIRLFAGKGSRRAPYRPRPESRVVVSTRTTATVVVSRPAQSAPTMLQGQAWVIDGDTIVIDKVHIRLAGIDAPELDHPWGQKAKWALVQLCKGQVITAQIRPELSYDRLVGECFLPDGRDLAAELVSMGMALDWTKFSGGKYRHLEPEDARKRLWRADLRQNGRLWTQGKF